MPVSMQATFSQHSICTHHQNCTFRFCQRGRLSKSHRLLWNAVFFTARRLFVVKILIDFVIMTILIKKTTQSDDKIASTYVNYFKEEAFYLEIKSMMMIYGNRFANCLEQPAGMANLRRKWILSTVTIWGYGACERKGGPKTSEWNSHSHRFELRIVVVHHINIDESWVRVRVFTRHA